MLDERRIGCPYCGEPVDLLVDASGGSQHYVEDCPVCCRPIEVFIEIGDDGSLVGIRGRREDE